MKYLSHEILSQGVWSYDAVISHGRVGSVRDPILITTTDGQEVVPACLEYVSSTSGNRRSTLFGGTFSKQFRDYAKVGFKEGSESVEDFIIHDEQAEVSILALPIEADTQVVSSQEAVTRFLAVNPDSPQAIAVQRISEFFPLVKFGLLGSCLTLLNNGDSDVDLIAFGGNEFDFVSQQLRDPHVQKHLRMESIPGEWQDGKARNYAKRFNINFERAKRIALLKNRFIVHVDPDKVVEISVAGSFKREEYKGQTVLGSKKVRKISECGIAIDTRQAGSLPREYQVEIPGQALSVIAMQEVMKTMVRTGDKVEIRGTLRETRGVQFISIEDYEDIIIASKDN